MPNNQTNEDSKLIDRDREVDEILEESKYLLDQEKMELTAQKYRAKQPVAEIFSNADKKPRLENSNPLDVDKEQTKMKFQATKQPLPCKPSLFLRVRTMATRHRKTKF